MQDTSERLVGEHDYLMILEIGAEFLHNASQAQGYMLHFLVPGFRIDHRFADVVDMSLLFV